MIWCPPDVPHFPVVQPFCQLTRDVAGPVVRQQSRLLCINSCRLVPELISSLNDDEFRTGYQIKGFEQAIDGSLRDKVFFCVCEADGQFPLRQR
jgi:hypothetical protein